MRIIASISILLVIFITSSVASSARGMVAPPPRWMGGNTGAWIGDGGSGPIFGFDDPWGKDFPFGGGGIGDPGFTGWLDGGDWTRGGSTFSGGNNGNNGGTGGHDECTDRCQENQWTNGNCIPICYCRTHYHRPGFIACAEKLNHDWDGRMCGIFAGLCEPKPEEPQE